MRLTWAGFLLCLAAAPSDAAPHYVIVQGLPGEPGYEERFSEETGKIAEAAKRTAGDPARVHLLTDRGAWMTSAHYNYSPTVTAPGHASFLSGAPPSVHGIIGNEWFDRQLRQVVVAVDDPEFEEMRVLLDAVHGGAPLRQPARKRLFQQAQDRIAGRRGFEGRVGHRHPSAIRRKRL